VADRLGLNPTDHKCVDFLLMNGPLTAGELATLTALTTGAITAALDRLERAGFAKREDDPDDRRRVSELIDRKYDHGLPPAEEAELALLQDALHRYIDQVAPLPLDVARGLHQELLQKAARARATGNP
jgi:hypothetical protein